MAITFDPNRVGPGTFKLVRDASTGTYSIQEVGFTKLPSLTLPDLTPTTTTPTPTPTPDPDTPDVSQPKLPQVGGGGDERSVGAARMEVGPVAALGAVAALQAKAAS